MVRWKRGKKCHYFWRVDISISVHIDGKNKNFLVLDEGPTRGLDNTTITAEAKYLINYTNSGKSLC